MSEASVIIFVSASGLGCVRSITEAKACLICVKAADVDSSHGKNLAMII